jgi:hypothetical protein
MVCIYAIKNTVNGKIYVGSTENMTARFKKHKSSLKRGCHCNIHLQRAYDQYGEDCLDFIILATCGKHQLIKKELEFIDKYHSLDETYGYNLILPREPATRSISPILRKTLSEKKKGIIPLNLKQMQKVRWKKVNVFQDNVLINTYESVRVAEESLGIKRGNIHNYLKEKTTGIKYFKHLHFEYGN